MNQSVQSFGFTWYLLLHISSIQNTCFNSAEQHSTSHFSFWKSLFQYPAIAILANDDVARRHPRHRPFCPPLSFLLHPASYLPRRRVHLGRNLDHIQMHYCTIPARMPCCCVQMHSLDYDSNCLAGLDDILLV